MHRAPVEFPRVLLTVVAGLIWVMMASGCDTRTPPEVLGSVPEFDLVDQRGRPVTRQTLQGRRWAVAFMFTRCPTICPRITKAMRSLQSSAKSSDVELELISISVDPEHDTPKVLQAYARRFGADEATWRFLTGDRETIQRLADGAKIALEGKVDEDADHLGIMHGSHLMLVDRQGRIRGYYRSSDPEAHQQLLHAAARL